MYCINDITFFLHTYVRARTHAHRMIQSNYIYSTYYIYSICNFLYIYI